MGDSWVRFSGEYKFPVGWASRGNREEGINIIKERTWF